MSVEITQILSKRRLDILRDGYRKEPGVAAQAALGIASKYAGGVKIVEALTHRFFTTRLGSGVVQPPLNQGVLAEKDRERCLIMLFAATKDRFQFVAHCYWGLMEGLEVPEIAEVLLLVCGYEGIDQYVNSQKWLEDWLQKLEDKDEIVTPMDVVRTLAAYQ